MILDFNTFPINTYSTSYFICTFKYQKYPFD